MGASCCGAAEAAPARRGDAPAHRYVVGDGARLRTVLSNAEAGITLPVGLVLEVLAVPGEEENSVCTVLLDPRYTARYEAEFTLDMEAEWVEPCGCPARSSLQTWGMEQDEEDDDGMLTAHDHQEDDAEATLGAERAGAVARLRGHLRDAGFAAEAADTAYLSDAYLDTVLRAQKGGRQRTFAYAAQKMVDMLRWRRDTGIARAARADVAAALAPGHMWVGIDLRSGHAVLCIRAAGVRQVRPYVSAQYVRAQMVLLEEAVRLMRGGTESTFIVAINTAGAGVMDGDARGLLNFARSVQVGYPDRLAGLYVAPVNAVARAMFRVIKPLLPGPVAAKIHFGASLASALGGAVDLDSLPSPNGALLVP